jgi:hypothetical protein
MSRKSKTQQSEKAQDSAGRSTVPGRPFVKGDPRRYKGPPVKMKAFFELRKLAQAIAEEPVLYKNQLMVRAEQILRQMSESSDRRDQARFIEIAYGKVEDRVLTSNFDVESLLEKIDLEKLTQEQLDQLASGKNIIEVLLVDYIK